MIKYGKGALPPLLTRSQREQGMVFCKAVRFHQVSDFRNLKSRNRIYVRNGRFLDLVHRMPTLHAFSLVRAGRIFIRTDGIY